MSNDIIVENTLPVAIVALQHSTLDEAMELCAQAHAIAIPDASIDEHGCRSAIERANTIYRKVKELTNALDEARLQRGREIKAIKDRIDDVVKAALAPLEDQRGKLGQKLMTAGTKLDGVIREKQRLADEERRREEEERRQQALAAERAQLEAARLAADAQEKARAAAAAAAEQAQGGDDPVPDLDAAADVERAQRAATAAQAKADAERIAAIDRSFEPMPAATYVPPAPKLAVTKRKVAKLRIDDLALVPRSVGDVPLFTFDEAAAKRLLVAGIKIPGLSLEYEESVGAKGRSSAYAV